MADYAGIILVSIAGIGFGFIIWHTNRTMARWREERRAKPRPRIAH